MHDLKQLAHEEQDMLSEVRVGFRILLRKGYKPSEIYPGLTIVKKVAVKKAATKPKKASTLGKSLTGAAGKLLGKAAGKDEYFDMFELPDLELPPLPDSTPAVYDVEEDDDDD